MLVLNRNKDESFFIGDVKVTILKTGSRRVRLGIQADPSILILREELKEKESEESTNPSDPGTS